MQSNDLTSYFHSIKSEDDLTRMITDHVKEDLYLEFKQKHDRRHAQLEDDDKFNFSRALSGFANSDGGTLIWGVETYKKDESAKSLKPITDVDGFIRSLKSSMINSVQPFVDNVLIEKIPTDASEQIGFVKCLIPRVIRLLTEQCLQEENITKGAQKVFTVLNTLTLKICLAEDKDHY